MVILGLQWQSRPADAGADMNSETKISRGKRRPPIPAPTFVKLSNIIKLANGPHNEAFAAALADLLDEIPEWPIGISEVPTIMKDVDGSFSVCLKLAKPHSKDPSDRRFDVEAFFVFLCHFVAGGRIHLSPQGKTNTIYYPRLSIGSSCRPYILPILSPSPRGRLTSEPDNYHDLRRRNLGESRRPEDDEQGSWLGVASVKAATLDLVGKLLAYSRPPLPPGVTVESIRQLLEDAYSVLYKVPLGRREAP